MNNDEKECLDYMYASLQSIARQLMPLIEKNKEHVLDGLSGQFDNPVDVLNIITQMANEAKLKD